ncbi:hypothetical protein [Chryseobacterium flavum]|uniref:hypothetical protein n=1 Tax=Chryseobacterium flavum TaxID=415851 RepID=UPI0028AED00A|nr:hypothetical protein [Chryseobacterium flavum]
MKISGLNNTGHQEKYESTFIDRAIQMTGLHFYSDQQNVMISDGRELDLRAGIIFSETPNELPIASKYNEGYVNNDFACKEMLSIFSLSLAFGVCSLDNKHRPISGI